MATQTRTFMQTALLNLEYDINPVILTGGIRKQFEGFDGWVGDISIKYTF